MLWKSHMKTWESTVKDILNLLIPLNYLLVLKLIEEELEMRIKINKTKCK